MRYVQGVLISGEAGREATKLVTPQQCCCGRTPSSDLLEMPAVRHDLLHVAAARPQAVKVKVPSCATASPCDVLCLSSGKALANPGAYRQQRTLTQRKGNRHASPPHHPLATWTPSS